MPTRRTFLVLSAGIAAAGLVRAIAGQPRPRSAVRVTREEPVVTRIEFDPRSPPAGMPPLTPPEAGICKSTYELNAGVNYSAARLSRTTARIYIDELDIVTRLRFDIYTQQGAPAKLRAHEEGHREIGEHYYRNAAAIAEGIGARLIGTEHDGEGADQEAAQQDAFNKVVAEIEQAYMARVRSPSAAANDRYDEITRHGLAPIDEAEAIARSLA
jgi:hypothetical protein